MSFNENIYFASLVDTLQKHPLLKDVADIISKNATSNYSDILKAATDIAAGQGHQKSGSQFLASVFDGLTYDKDIKKNIWANSKGFQYHLNTLSLDEEKDVFFPTKETPKTQDDLLKSLKTDLAKVKDSAENIFHLLEKYTVNIPSHFENNIAFYDYLKVKTAAAICLAQEPKAEKQFLLIGTGVSGIQNFLFDIVSKKASVNLKGRSLYLQLLPELVVARILQDLNLFSPNILYSSGGNAYILAPNTESNISKLETIRNDVSNALFKAHGIGLYLEMAWEETTSEELTSSAKAAMKRLNVCQLAAQKRHKLSIQIANDDTFFEPKEEGGEQFRDAITGEELNEKDKLFDVNLNETTSYHQAIKDRDNDKQPQLIGELTKYLMTQGQYLEDRKYLVIQSNSESIEPFKSIGFSYQIVKNTEGVVGKVYDLQGLDFLPKAHSINSDAVYGFSFYGGNDFAKIQVIQNKEKKWATKTYSELGGQIDDENGKRIYVDDFIEPTFKRLAVLRMDVDGLGKVFIDGFSSLTTYSVLSRSLDYFFKGYLNTIWATGSFKAFNKTAEKKELPFSKYIQIVYAGGDDLFAVGRWDAIIAFGKEVRERFKDWVCHNPNFGISGGISLVTPKHPVIKAAEYADDAEKDAKKHKFNGQEKNAISMMGVTMNWDYEFTVVESLKNTIIDLTDKSKYTKPLPNAFLFNVAGFYETVESNLGNGIEDYRWVWQMAYDLTRMKDRCKPTRDDKTDVVDFLKSLIDWTILRKTPESVSKLIKIETIGYFTFFKLLNLACIWASYELRDKGHSDNN